jgi:tetratricopeptide (TPR) repeat protein
VIWEGVLHEQLGETDQAQASLAHAQELMADQPAMYWITLGNDRLQAGNLDGAEAAGNQALVLKPDDAQATFLLGGVAEARGDNAKAIELFDKTFQLAQKDNPQLAVIARVRMGQLMQQVSPFGPTSPVTTPATTPQQ